MIAGYKIKYLSPHTSIKSYTLFGAFCWGYRFLKGKSSLETFLNEFEKNPKFLISSPFPLSQERLLFPKPVLPLKDEENLSIVEKLKRKPYKKAKYITQSVFEDFLNGKIKKQNDFMKNYKVKDGIIHQLNESIEKILKKEIIITHNEINRLNNTSKNLYFESGILSNEEYFLVKFLDEDFKEDFDTVLKFIEDIGLGRNKNIGWGRVKIIPLEKDFSFLNTRKNDTFITLSPMIPSENCLLNESFYTFSTYKSFTEGSFSEGKVKNKVVYLEEGSLIKVKDSNSFTGAISKTNNVFQYGLEFPIHLELNDD